MVKKKLRLPNELIIFKNRDKADHEHWGQSKKPTTKVLNFPAPFIYVLLGKRNSGKTNIIMNVLLHQKPSFEKYFMWSQSPMSKEYEMIDDLQVFDTCPHLEDDLLEELQENGKPFKSVLIVDDVNLETLNKEDYDRFSRIIKHGSSHYNISLIITCHDLIQCPKICRRLADIITLFKLQPETIKIIGQKIGMPNEELFRMFEDNVKEYHDSLTIDMTQNSPMPFRKNLFEEIKPLVKYAGKLT